MRQQLRERTVLVTGGGSGLGRLMALGAANRGAKVVIWDLDAESAVAVRDEIQAAGGEARSQTVDVGDRDAVRNAAMITSDVDVLINNAGVVTGKELLDASEEAIERTLRVNTLALFWVTRAFLPGMIKRGNGTVVTMASAAGLVGVARQTDYSASKFAAVGFTESLRAELRKQRTGVNALVVCPYYIDTGMFSGVRTKLPRLLPIMQPEYGTEKVLNAIESGKRQLLLPRFVRTVSPARALPVPLFDWLMDRFGINNTMDHFHGHAERQHTDSR